MHVRKRQSSLVVRVPRQLASQCLVRGCGMKENCKDGREKRREIEEIGEVTGELETRALVLAWENKYHQNYGCLYTNVADCSCPFLLWCVHLKPSC